MALSLLALLASCGETTRNAQTDGSAGTLAAEVPSAGMAAVAGRGGVSAAGTKGGGPNGGAAPGGGRLAADPSVAGTDQAGGNDGGGGEAPICTSGYAGPTGGPRLAGPTMPPGGCAFIPTETILARYRDFQARVPEGLYYEADAGVVSWETTPCSKSPEETVQRGTALLGSAIEQFETDWFYETVSCLDGQRHAYRNVRCDYFDGTKLANPNVLNLGFLESLLWWALKSNVEGSALINYSIMLGDSTDRLELCTIRTERGGPGQCDQVIVQSKQNSIFEGVVTFGPTTEVATVPGDCH